MADDPGRHSPDVLVERIANLATTMARIDERMTGLATAEQVTGLIKAGDEVLHTRLDGAIEDIKEITAALAAERAERQAADKEASAAAKQLVEGLKADIRTSRTMALTAIGLVLTAFFGVVGLIVSVGGLG